MNLTCKQFENLMIFYIDNELQNNLKNAFETHLMVCKDCRQKYYLFKTMINNIRNSYKLVSKTTTKKEKFNSKDSIANISAYIDNELETKENLKIKKLIITKPSFRKKFEAFEKLSKLLKTNFSQIKPEENYSKNLLKKIKIKEIYNKNKEIINCLISFISLCVIWIIMLICTI